MAFLTATHFEKTAREGFITRFFKKLIELAEQSGRIEARTREIERLNAMSDESLAKMGLTRSNITQYVFRDLYYM